MQRRTSTRLCKWNFSTTFAVRLRRITSQQSFSARNGEIELANKLHSAKFTEAIEIEPTNHILYSNRSAAYASKKEWASAFEDAEKVTQIKPDWAKGWGRKGAALHGKGDLIGALDAYEEGLKLDPNNTQNKSGLASVKRAIDAEAKEGKSMLDGKGIQELC